MGFIYMSEAYREYIILINQSFCVKYVIKKNDVCYDYVYMWDVVMIDFMFNNNDARFVDFMNHHRVFRIQNSVSEVSHRFIICN